MSEPKTVQLRFPAVPGYLRLSRLNAATLAADLGYTLDELDELRLAVNEAVNWLVAYCDDAEVVMTMTAADDTLTIQGEAVGGSPKSMGVSARDDPKADELFYAVLGATLDSFCVEVRDGRPRMNLVSHHREQ